MQRVNLLPHTFANRVYPDQAALVRAALLGSTLFAHGHMIRYDSTLVDLMQTKHLCVLIHI